MSLWNSELRKCLKISWPISFVLFMIYLQPPFWRWQQAYRASWQMTAQFWKPSPILTKSRNVKRMWEDLWVLLDLYLTMSAELQWLCVRHWKGHCQPKWRGFFITFNCWTNSTWIYFSLNRVSRKIRIVSQSKFSLQQWFGILSETVYHWKIVFFWV